MTKNQRNIRETDLITHELYIRVGKGRASKVWYWETPSLDRSNPESVWQHCETLLDNFTDIFPMLTISEVFVCLDAVGPSGTVAGVRRSRGNRNELFLESRTGKIVEKPHHGFIHRLGIFLDRLFPSH